MKGLLLKDLCELKSYKKSFIITMLLYSVIILTNDEEMVFLGATMIMFLFSIYAMATFNYDENSKSDRYVLTLPLTRKEVILSKYVLAILSLVIGAIIGTLLSVILSYIKINELPYFDNLFSTLLGGFVVLSFMQSIQIPCIYKCGAEKGRSQIYIFMMILFAILGFGYMLFPNIDLSFLDKLDAFVPIILISLIIINYVISYKISCKIYMKKSV